MTLNQDKSLPTLLGHLPHNNSPWPPRHWQTFAWLLSTAEEKSDDRSNKERGVWTYLNSQDLPPTYNFSHYPLMQVPILSSTLFRLVGALVHSSNGCSTVSRPKHGIFFVHTAQPPKSGDLAKAFQCRYWRQLNFDHFREWVSGQAVSHLLSRRDRTGWNMPGRSRLRSYRTFVLSKRKIWDPLWH